VPYRTLCLCRESRSFRFGWTAESGLFAQEEVTFDQQREDAKRHSPPGQAALFRKPLRGKRLVYYSWHRCPFFLNTGITTATEMPDLFTRRFDDLASHRATFLTISYDILTFPSFRRLMRAQPVEGSIMRRRRIILGHHRAGSKHFSTRTPLRHEQTVKAPPCLRSVALA
jgi:hypothetical protein